MIKKVVIENFRGFKNHTIDLNETSIIVGKNNAGKSTLIEALRIASIIVNRYRNLNYRPSPTWLSKWGRRGIYPSLTFTDINKETLFHNYDMPPSYIEIVFKSGIKLEISIGESAELFCQIVKQNGDIVKSKIQASKIMIPSVSILPQIKPLQESENILNEEYIKSNLFSLRSSLHFRNQLHYFSNHFKEFKNLAESTWPGLRINDLVVQKDLLGKGNIDLLVQDGAFASEIGWMGDGIQMWLQIMWFLALAKKSDTVILDEPDVYMHPDLQRRLIRLLIKEFNQVIVATHSVEIISEVEPENILVLDKSQNESRFADTLPAVQNVIENIGTVHNLQLARLWTSQKAILVEGSDLKMLKHFQNTLYPNSIEPMDTIPNMSIGGWGGWNYAVGSTMMLKNSIGENILVYCILDRDFHSEEKILQRLKDADEKNVCLKIWNKKEIENYLLDCDVILRYLEKNKQNKSKLNKKIIQDKLSSLAEDFKEETIQQIANEIQKSNRFDINRSMKEAKKVVSKSWESLSDKLSIIPGKKAFDKLSKWSFKKYGTTISKIKLIKTFDRSSVPAEIKYVLESIEQGKAF